MVLQMKKPSKSLALQTAQNHCLCPPLPQIIYIYKLPQINKQIAPFLNIAAALHPTRRRVFEVKIDDDDDKENVITSYAERADVRDPDAKREKRVFYLRLNWYLNEILYFDYQCNPTVYPNRYTF